MKAVSSNLSSLASSLAGKVEESVLKRSKALPSADRLVAYLKREEFSSTLLDLKDAIADGDRQVIKLLLDEVQGVKDVTLSSVEKAFRLLGDRLDKIPTPDNHAALESVVADLTRRLNDIKDVIGNHGCEHFF